LTTFDSLCCTPKGDNQRDKKALLDALSPEKASADVHLLKRLGVPAWTELCPEAFAIHRVIKAESWSNDPGIFPRRR
jgi:hypothetical protein